MTEITVKQGTLNIWRLYEQGYWIVNPTNVYVKSDRKAVMGRGVAQQIAGKFPEITTYYGELLLGWVRPRLAPGREPKLKDLDELQLIQFDMERKIIFLPVKTMWDQPADLELIEKSLNNFKGWLKSHPGVQKIALPHIGCGNGHLDWESQVKPLVRAFLVDLDPEDRARFVIVNPPEYLEAFGVK